MKNQSPITRRHFLQTTGAATAAAALWKAGSLACLGAETFAPPVAVFSKVYQELKLSFEESAEATADAGLDGVDCTVRSGGEILPEHAAEEMPRYAEALEKHKVRMLLLTTGIVSVSSPHAEAILRTGKKLGIKYYRLGYWSHQTGTSPEQLYSKIKAQLTELAALNRELGLCGVYQNHSAGKGQSNGQVGGDLAELYEIVKDLNPDQIGVAFDPGHAILTHGDGWRAHFEKLKPHIRVAYIKDTKRGAGFVPFGEGEFSKLDIFQQLKKMNCRAPLSLHIEFDWAGKGKPKTRQALVKALTESRQTLQRWLAAA